MELLSLIRGDRKNLWKNLVRQFPELIEDFEFAKSIIDNINSEKLEKILILSGYLPGINEISLEDRISKYYKIINKHAIVKSIHDDLTPDVLNSLYFDNNTVKVLIEVSILSNDRDMLWAVFKAASDRFINKIINTATCVLNNSNYKWVLELLYLRLSDEYNDDNIRRKAISQILRYSYLDTFNFVIEYFNSLGYSVEQLLDVYIKVYRKISLGTDYIKFSPYIPQEVLNKY